MDSSNESFTISSKQTLIENQPPSSAAKPTVKRSYRKTITVALLILVTIIAISITLFYVWKNEKEDKEPLNRYLSSASKYYCHVTRYPDLCYESMASVINSTSSLIKYNPIHIFTSSIQASINEAQKAGLVLNRTASFLSSETNSNCEKWMKSSLNLLVKSLDVLGNVSDTDSLTFYEMDNVRTYMKTSASYTMKCVSALDRDDYGSNDTTTSEVKRGLEEVRTGVERARRCVVNSNVLWSYWEMILEEFYNPYVVDSARDNYYYYHYSYYYLFDYNFLVCMYAVMYLFLALLYYLFWHSK